jgi:hypothetical protein
MNIPLPSYDAHIIIKNSVSAALIYLILIVIWLWKHYDEFSTMKTKLIYGKASYEKLTNIK